MANKPKIVPSQNRGFFPDLILRARLILRLMADRRVNIFIKFIPVVAVIYVLLPIDLIPEIALPIVGYLDDAAVLWFGISLFVSLCPDEVVKEHMNALKNVVPGTWRDAPPEEQGGEVVESEARDMPDDQESH
jgi:uncharacterized membrane protein YkvA (DUF1232 family)